MPFKKPAASMAKAALKQRPAASDDGAKGLGRLALIEPGEAMGRNTAQAIVDRLKAIQKTQPEHQGLPQYKSLKSNEEKRQFGMKLHIDRNGDHFFETLMI